MTWLVRHRYMRLAAGGTLTLLALLAVSTSPAHASCGDYVHFGARHGAADMTGAVAAKAQPRAGQLPDVPPPVPCPCSGAQCSASPPMLPGTPVPPAPTGGGAEWGLLAVADCLLHLERTPAPIQEGLLMPQSLTTSIYHPPR